MYARGPQQRGRPSSRPGTNAPRRGPGGPFAYPNQPQQQPPQRVANPANPYGGVYPGQPRGAPGYPFGGPVAYPGGPGGYPIQGAHPGFAPHRGATRRVPAASGPQLPFARELLDRVPTENVGDSLPFLSEVRTAAQDFVHQLPSEALPFVDELRDTKPAVPAAEGSGGAEVERFGTTKKLSQAVRHAGTVYLSAAVPGDRSGDIAAQARDVLGKIAFRLKEADSDPSRLLTASVYLASIKDMKEFVKVWEEWLPTGAAPAFTCVESKLGNPQWKIQVSAVAAVDQA